MKTLLVVFLFSMSAWAQSYYTLDNVKSLKIYFANETGFITPDQEKQLKQQIQDKLESAGFIFGQTDAHIFVIKIEDMEVEDSLAINVQVKLGEEVITKRIDDIQTFAYTYLQHQLFEGYAPYEDTKEKVLELVNDFIVAHQDDNEE